MCRNLDYPRSEAEIPSPAEIFDFSKFRHGYCSQPPLVQQAS
jgi:hypothetical protein